MKISIYDVTLRDGFQGLSKPIPTGAKVEVAGMLSNAGFPYIELGSFISPKAGQIFENLKDTAEVYRQAKREEGVIYCALTPTIKYYGQAAKAGFDDVAVVISANENHNKLNLGKSVAETIDDIGNIVSNAHSDNNYVRVYVSTAFGYKSPDDVPFCEVENILQDVMAKDMMHISGISIGDTTGLARYRRVANDMATISREHNTTTIGLHIHQSEPDIWKPNVISAVLCEGVDVFDASLCGLGGCPTDDGYMGNTPTEQLVDFLEANKIGTGLDVDKVHHAAEFLHGILKKEGLSE